MANIILIEPFYGGSHKQLIDLLYQECESHGARTELYTLPAKKWHWRARVAALYFAENIPVRTDENKNGVLFTSSVLNLTELVGLRPDLANYHKIVYFHENQLNYPVQKQKERDFQYGYNQVLSCLVADEVVFNSQYNQDSFLSSIQSFFKLMPDHRPKYLSEKIRPRCKVLYFPLTVLSDSFTKNSTFQDGDPFCDISESREIPDFAEFCSDSNTHFGSALEACHSDCLNPSFEKMVAVENCCQQLKCDQHSPQSSPLQCVHHKHFQNPKVENTRPDVLSASVDNKSTLQSKPLHIVWPHRWEHDKGPELFFDTLRQLRQDGFTFNVSVLGESFVDIPVVFEQAKIEFADCILNWGFQHSRTDYMNVLQQADVVVSTAEHEFFGVAMLEAVLLGCYPCCPNKLVYPEIFPGRYLYNTSNQLLKMLKKLCQKPSFVRQHKLEVDIKKYCWPALKKDYLNLLRIT